MRRLVFLCSLLGGLTALGCLHDDEFRMRSHHHLENVPTPPTPSLNNSTSTGVAAGRLGQVGQALLQANPDLEVAPYFLTLGTKTPEIFHRGTREVWVSEGVIQQCSDDAALAAVLASELGKMQAERTALAEMRRRQEPFVPLTVSAGNDTRELSSTNLHLGEALKHGNDRRQPKEPITPPDPELFARTILANAGYAPESYDASKPLLQKAKQQGSFERGLGKLLGR